MGQSYRELIAWQKAMDYVMEVYRATSSFPRDEVYGLAAQMRRGATAIPSNIAQGQARYSPGEFHQHLGRARGSLVKSKLMCSSRRTWNTYHASKLKFCWQKLPSWKNFERPGSRDPSRRD